MRLSNKSATTGFYNKNIYIFCFYLKNCVGLSQSYFLLSLLVIFPIQNFPFKLLGATKKKVRKTSPHQSNLWAIMSSRPIS